MGLREDAENARLSRDAAASRLENERLARQDGVFSSAFLELSVLCQESQIPVTPFYRNNGSAKRWGTIIEVFETTGRSGWIGHSAFGEEAAFDARGHVWVAARELSRMTPFGDGMRLKENRTGTSWTISDGELYLDTRGHWMARILTEGLLEGLVSGSEISAPSEYTPIRSP
jgi:hypothetical protein